MANRNQSHIVAAPGSNVAYEAGTGLEQARLGFKKMMSSGQPTGGLGGGFFSYNSTPMDDKKQFILGQIGRGRIQNPGSKFNEGWGAVGSPYRQHEMMQPYRGNISQAKNRNYHTWDNYQDANRLGFGKDSPQIEYGQVKPVGMQRPVKDYVRPEPTRPDGGSIVRPAAPVLPPVVRPEPTHPSGSGTAQPVVGSGGGTTRDVEESVTRPAVISDPVQQTKPSPQVVSDPVGSITNTLSGLVTGGATSQTPVPVRTTANNNFQSGKTISGWTGQSGWFRTPSSSTGWGFVNKNGTLAEAKAPADNSRVISNPLKSSTSWYYN